MSKILQLRMQCWHLWQQPSTVESAWKKHKSRTKDNVFKIWLCLFYFILLNSPFEWFEMHFMILYKWHLVFKCLSKWLVDLQKCMEKLDCNAHCLRQHGIEKVSNWGCFAFWVYPFISRLQWELEPSSNWQHILMRYFPRVLVHSKSKQCYCNWTATPNSLSQLYGIVGAGDQYHLVVDSHKLPPGYRALKYSINELVTLIIHSRTVLLSSGH